jgi:hypothetical protein
MTGRATMEGAMDQIRIDPSENSGHRVTRRLHPRVYTLMIGLALWLVLSVWLFAGTGVADYLLVIVSGFIVVAVALPLILSRVTRIDDATDDDEPQSYHDWSVADFDTWQGRLSGAQAATQILLPIAAVAIGMTVFGIALHVAEHAGPAAPTSAYSSGSVVKNSG